MKISIDEAWYDLISWGLDYQGGYTAYLDDEYQRTTTWYYLHFGPFHLWWYSW